MQADMDWMGEDWPKAARCLGSFAPAWESLGCRPVGDLCLYGTSPRNFTRL
jgi:hypothetical protein